MRNAGLEEAQAGIKIDRRNTNNLRYADDTTLMAEREKELKTLLMKVKEKIEKAREFQKNIIFVLLTMPKPLTVWITTNCGKF